MAGRLCKKKAYTQRSQPNDCQPAIDSDGCKRGPLLIARSPRVAVSEQAKPGGLGTSARLKEMPSGRDGTYPK